ncbi:hypothetical protein C0J52_19033 [Blattella germanica]|nr:hypothetical protein C0J52_19033 [Blattella germanica]
MAPENKFQDGLYATCLLQNLFELQQSECLCDVTINVNGRNIKAHKAVLASASPYFRTMFSSGLKEATENSIVLHEMEYSAVREIVCFFYTGQIEITEDNVYWLMEIADLLQVSSVKASCSHYLISTLNTSNCLSAYARASLQNYNDLAHKAFRFVLQNFRHVMQEEEFLHVSPEIILKVLSSRLLNVLDEGELLEGVLEWWKHNKTERTQYLKNMTSKINLEKIPMEKLLTFKRDPLLADTELSAQISDSINSVLAQRYDNGDIKSLYQLRHKKILWKERYSSEQEVILAIGGESSGMALGSVECMTLGYDSWKCLVPTSIQEGEPCEETRVIPTMRYPRFYVAVAAKDYEVFVIVLDVVEYYSIQSNVWSDLAPLPVAVQGAGAAFLYQQLYVVGGKGERDNEKRVWMYEEFQNGWHEAPSMNKYRGYHGLVAVGGAIYAIGGIGAENANLYDLKLRSSVALYTEDTDTPAWWANFEKDLLSEFSKRKLLSVTSEVDDIADIENIPEIDDDDDDDDDDETSNNINVQSTGGIFLGRN